MLDSGYVRLYRSFLKWEWYDDINTKSVFLHLILTANYEPKQWHGITIQRGQRIYSSQKMATELHVSRQVIRTAVNHLISTGEITNQSTPQFSIITVKNYDLYQQVTNDLTNEQPTTNQPSTNEQPQLKKAKESNKDKKDICADAFASYAKEDSELLKALHDYAEMRKKKKKPLSTERAIKMLFSDLEKLASDSKTQIAILNQSVFNNWTGVFPLKAQPELKKPEHKPSYDIEAYENSNVFDNFDRK